MGSNKHTRRSNALDKMKISPFFKDWLAREKRTALLVKTTYKVMRRSRLSADDIWNLCRLTWITKGGGFVSDAYSKSTKLPALKALLNVEDSANNVDALIALIAKRGRLSNTESSELIYDDTGIVNLYTAFRNISRQWMAKNLRKISLIISQALTSKYDYDASNLCAKILQLPQIKQPKTGSGLPAVNILTPLIACLDPRSRFPILNKPVSMFLKDIGLGSRNKLSQYLNLIRLVKILDCRDALELDVLCQAADEKLLVELKRALQQYQSRPLLFRTEADIIALQKHQTVVKRNLHNAMTNRLVAMLGGQCDQGIDRNAMWDVLVRRGSYAKKDLLIEVKSVADVPSARMAVGQLLDYKRHIGSQSGLKLAVLFSEKPERNILNYLSSVGIDCLWFSGKMFEKVKNALGVVWV